MDSEFRLNKYWKVLFYTLIANFSYIIVNKSFAEEVNVICTNKDGAWDYLRSKGHVAKNYWYPDYGMVTLEAGYM